MKRSLVLIVFLLFMIPVVSAELVPRDFYVEVAKNNVPGHSLGRMSGINPAVGVAYEDLISVGGSYVFPITANQVNVSSTDVDDVNGGNGAWNVTIEGLDANWNPINETILLNGQNNVTSTLSYLRINCFYARRTGSSGVNEGTISAQNSLYLAEIIPDHGELQYSIYSIPDNVFAMPYQGWITSSEDKGIEVELQVRAYGESWRTSPEIFSYRTNTIFDIKTFKLIPPRSDVKIKAKVAATTGEIGGTINFLLIESSVLNNSTLQWADGSPSEVTINDPVDINIVESIDLMASGFTIFTIFAALLTYLGSVSKAPGDRMMRFMLSFIFWIASLSQWIADGGGMVALIALIAPTIMSLVWAIQALGESTEHPMKKNIYSLHEDE